MYADEIGSIPPSSSPVFGSWRGVQSKQGEISDSGGIFRDFEEQVYNGKAF